MLAPKNISAAIVGFGRMGNVHLDSCSKLGVKVTAICDLQKIESLGKSINYYSNLSLMLTEEKPNLLIIATTANTHFEIIKEAVLSKIPMILCEKPLHTSLQESHEISALNNEGLSRIAVNHQMRFLDQYAMIKKIENEGNLGKMNSMIVSASHFGLGMNVTHYFEAFRFITNEEIYEVSGYLDKDEHINPRGPQFTDQSGQVFCRSRSGKRLFIDFGNDLGHGLISTYNFNYGKIIVNELTGEVTVNKRHVDNLKMPMNRYGTENLRTDFSIPAVELVESTKKVIEALIQDENFPSFDDGNHAIQVAFAVIHSSKLGGTMIKVDDPGIQLISSRWA